jgi:hypothetical protein
MSRIVETISKNPCPECGSCANLDECTNWITYICKECGYVWEVEKELICKWCLGNHHSNSCKKKEAIKEGIAKMKKWRFDKCR